MRVLKVACCAVAIVACLTPGARADEWNKKTYLTFSGPVQIPGATLPAGTYLFQLADPDTSRHVVMVASKDGTQVYGMFITIPNERLEASAENVVMFGESPAGTPQAIEAWWYPGDRVGEEFVYPKNQAMQIARVNHKSVLATESEMNGKGSEAERMGALRGSKVARVDENGRAADQPATNTAESVQKQSNKPATTTANRPATTTAKPSTTTADAGRTVGTTAEAATPAPSNTVNGRDVNSAKSRRAVGTSGAGTRELPRTASNLSLIELLSAVLLAGGLSLRFARGRWAAAR